MGKKWEVRKKVKTRDLVWVDDQPLKNEKSKEIHKVLKQTEVLQQKKADFEKKDLKLFEHWHQLEFGPTLKEIEEKRAEEFKLGLKQNEILAISEMDNLPMPLAYKVFLTEAKTFINGSDAEKQKIEKRRNEREVYIENKIREMEKERYADIWGDDEEDFEDFDDEDEDSDADGNDDNGPLISAEEIAALKAERDESLKLLRKKYSDVWNMPVGQVSWQKIDKSVEYLEMKLVYGHLTGDWKDFDLAYGKAPNGVRQRFEKTFKKFHKFEFKDAIDQMKQDSWDLNAILNGEVPVEDLFEERFGDTESGDDEFDDEFGDDEGDDGPFFDEGSNKAGYTFAQKHSKKQLSSEEIIEMKVVFRRIARFLHPDSQDAVVKNIDWQDFWGQAQRAHQQNDLMGLKELDLYLAFLLKDYGRLALDDFSALKRFAIRAKDTVSLSIQNLQDHPAWGFSTKKNLKKMAQKLRKPLTERLKNLTDSIKDFQDRFRDLEKAILFFENLNQGRRHRSKNNSRRHVKPKKKTKKHSKKEDKKQTHNPFQMSFNL